jgi:hypothetical protein
MAIIAGGDLTGRVEAGSRHIVSERSRGLVLRIGGAIQLEELYQPK